MNGYETVISNYSLRVLQELAGQEGLVKKKCSGIQSTKYMKICCFHMRNQENLTAIFYTHGKVWSWQLETHYYITKLIVLYYIVCI